MIKIDGKCGISATILADSISEAGIRLISFEVTYPRIILAELNTHGMICKNSASSRAIPFAKMQENLSGRPVRFGQANPGMQDKGESYKELLWSGIGTGKEQVKTYYTPEEAWQEANISALKWSWRFHDAGYHKQVYNRLTEPFQMMKTVLTATEWNNFFWLRDHVAADPTIAELARVMKEAREISKPVLLQPGEWHLPYVYKYWLRSSPNTSVVEYFIRQDDGTPVNLTLNDALAVSAARCAAVSFRNVDYGLDKCREVAAKLIGDDRKHGSAFQHQGTPMKESWNPACKRYDVNNSWNPLSWEQGISHADRNGQLWSAQFKGWIMYRKLIVGENKEG